MVVSLTSHINHFWVLYRHHSLNGMNDRPATRGFKPPTPRLPSNCSAWFISVLGLVMNGWGFEQYFSYNFTTFHIVSWFSRIRPNVTSPFTTCDESRSGDKVQYCDCVFCGIIKDVSNPFYETCLTENSQFLPDWTYNLSVTYMHFQSTIIKSFNQLFTANDSICKFISVYWSYITFVYSYLL